MTALAQPLLTDEDLILKERPFRSRHRVPQPSPPGSSQLTLGQPVLRLLCALLLALSAAGPLEAQQAKDTLLQEARELASVGKLAEAAAAYWSWLDRNAGHRDFVSILLEAADSQVSADKSLELLRTYTPRIQDPAQRELCMGYQIDLLEMLGRTERALGLLRSFPSSPRWLYRQANLLYQQGLFEEAESLLRQALATSGLDAGGTQASAPAGPTAGGTQASAPERPEAGGTARELQARIRLLLARIHSARGNSEPAEALYKLLQSEYAGSGAAPAALLAYYELLIQAGREGEAARILEELSTRFPEAPELALARGSEARITYAPSPGRLLPRDQAAGSRPQDTAPSSAPAAGSAAARVPVPAPQPAASAAPEQQAAAGTPPGVTPAPQPAATPKAEPVPQRNVLVQTGSFRDPENARYMVQDLKSSGFSASVVEKNISGNLYYRVVIAPPRSLEEAQRLLLSLKDANFEGVLLFPEEGNGAE